MNYTGLGFAPAWHVCVAGEVPDAMIIHVQGKRFADSKRGSKASLFKPEGFEVRVLSLHIQVLDTGV